MQTCSSRTAKSGSHMTYMTKILHTYGLPGIYIYITYISFELPSLSSFTIGSLWPMFQERNASEQSEAPGLEKGQESFECSAVSFS